MQSSEYKNIVQKLGPPLLQFVHYQIGDLEQAKDIVQETFIVLLQKLDSVDSVKCKSFIYAVAKNKTKDYFKLKKKQTPIQDIHRIEYSTPFDESKEIIHLALRNIKPKDREIICLRDLEGQSYPEISSLLNLSPTQVKVYLFRARKALKIEIIKLELNHAN